MLRRGRDHVRAACAPGVVYFLAIVCLCVPSSAKKVVVQNQAELVAALNDEAVDDIVFGKSSWNFTDEELPWRGATITGDRTVIVQGQNYTDGSKVYIDANRLTSRVYVTNGATLLQRNMWVDDCFNPTLETYPYTCFSETVGGGARVELRDTTVSDATCAKIADSAGINAMLNVIKLFKFMSATLTYIDDRTVNVADSGWIPFVPPTSSWRLANVNMTCTGNVTHVLPPRQVDIVIRGWRDRDVSVAMITTVAVAVAVLYWVRSKWLSKLPPEYHVARSQGYELTGRLGQGRSGVVYRALHLSSRSQVAIKVLTLRSNDSDQYRAASRECMLNASIKHPSCIRVITYYSASVTAAPASSRSPTVSPYSSGFDSGSMDGLGSGDTNGSGSGVNAMSANLKLSSSSSTSVATNNSSRSDPITAFQVHLVMDFADQGTLQDAVVAGRFQHPDGRPNLHWIIATAVEIIEGLTALHRPTIRLVHRDLSAANVLLTSDPTPRGFRAVLSDFGLSTVLAAGASHRTSDAKGSLAFMPPEVYSHDMVSPALDIYSFGVLFLFMLTGVPPYANWTAARIISHKLNANDDEQIDIPDAMLEHARGDPIMHSCVQIIRSCTRVDRRHRPSAETVASQVRTVLLRVEDRSY